MPAVSLCVTLLILLLAPCMLRAAEGGVIEEVIVHAQRVDENLQQVPMAASAFTGAMIKDRQIIGISDVQLSAPNVQYSDHSFARGRFVIRGVGRQDDEFASENGVAVHLNGIPIPVETHFEVFDLERLEVLRGPQGTLYGRNATGGAVNIITTQPTTESVEGYFSGEYGDYNHTQFQGAVNVPIGEAFAVRIAGFDLQRDGFTKNLAGEQVIGADDDLDGRDLWSVRATAKWWISDNLTLNVLYNHYDEDDDRLRNDVIVCRQNPLPTLGCLPGQSGFDAPHPDGFSNGFNTSGLGARQPGARNVATGLLFDVPRPELGFREQHTDFEPEHEVSEDIVAISLEWEVDSFRATLAGVYYEVDLLSRQDDRMDVGYLFNSTPVVPSGQWPTAALPEEPGGLYEDPQCNLQDHTAGVRGGCILPVATTRHYTYDSTNTANEQLTIEAKIHSEFDGPVNFLLGGSYLTSDRQGSYNRVNNVFDQIAVVGVPPNFPFPFVTGVQDLTLHRYDFETYSVFGELYWQATDAVKVTLGLRYNNDQTIMVEQSNGPFHAMDVTGGSTNPEFIRAQLFGWYLFGQPAADDVPLADLYGATDAILAATSDAERLEAFQLVPALQPRNENRVLRGVGEKETSTGISARAGVSWSPTGEHMLYTFYSRGYKPGSPILFGEPSVDTEYVDTVELGLKGKFLQGTLLTNAAVFWNNYDGLQLKGDSSGFGVPSSVTPGRVQNFDGTGWGAELELQWRPQLLPGAQLHLAYGWLHTELDQQLTFNPEDPLQGNTDYTLLRDRRFLYVARTSEVLPLVDQAVAQGFASPVPGTVYDNGIPAFFSQGYLNFFGVETAPGFTVDLEGNQIPSAPTHTLSVGISYDWHLSHGNIQARWDYYWQSRSFARIYNGAHDRLPSWHQHNVSLGYTTANGRWNLRAWVRNLADDHNISGQFSNVATTANTRSYTVNDPRLFGVSLQVNFGG